MRVADVVSNAGPDGRYLIRNESNGRLHAVSLDHLKSVPANRQVAVHWEATKPLSATRLGELEKLSEEGEIAAMFALGHEMDMRADENGAERWYLAAASRGEVDAMFSLAVVYEETHREPLALEWYERAAALSDERSKANLARLGR